MALDDPHTLFKLNTAAASAPAGNPGIFLIAKAAGDPQNAARHVYHLAKRARRYFAFHSTEYPHHTNMMRAAEQQELKWQLEHLHKCVADRGYRRRRGTNARIRRATRSRPTPVSMYGWGGGARAMMTADGQYRGSKTRNPYLFRMRQQGTDFSSQGRMPPHVSIGRCWLAGWR